MLGDIGFSEILLIMVIALIVVGPERLPGIARKAGKLVGKGRRFVDSVKDDINQEMAADDLKRIIEEQKQSIGMHEIIEETEEAIEAVKSDYMLDSIDDDVIDDDALSEKKLTEEVEDAAVEKEKKKAESDEPEK